MKSCLMLALPLILSAQVHRAEQSLEIRYWLQDPDTHQFKISHDFTIDRVGQKYVHSFVRKGSEVSPDARIICLDTGKQLKTYTVKGKDVNALGYYPTPTDPDSVVVQGDLEKPDRGRSLHPRSRRRNLYGPGRLYHQKRRTGLDAHAGPPVQSSYLAGRLAANVGEHARDHFTRRSGSLSRAIHQHPQRPTRGNYPRQEALTYQPICRIRI
jgi:hypothetical protein